MKICCDACHAEWSTEVHGPTLLKDTLPRGWRRKRMPSIFPRTRFHWRGKMPRASA